MYNLCSVQSKNYFRIENKKLFINILPYMPLYLYRFYNEEGFTLKSLLSKSFCYSNRCLLSVFYMQTSMS